MKFTYLLKKIFKREGLLLLDSDVEKLFAFDVSQDYSICENPLEAVDKGHIKVVAGVLSSIKMFVSPKGTYSSSFNASF